MEADFANFVRARQQTLVRAAYLVCGDHHLAEDVVQGALAKVARRWEQLREGNPEGYVRTIIYRDAISAWRKVRRETPRAMHIEGAAHRLVARDPARDWVDGAEVRAALAQLPPRQRAIVVLRYYEDLSEAQIAEVLGISAGTVKSQAHNAVRNLRAYLDVSAITSETGGSSL